MTTAGVIAVFDPAARLLRTQQPYAPNEPEPTRPFGDVPTLGVAGPESRPLPQAGPDSGVPGQDQKAAAGLAVDDQAVEGPAQRHRATRYAGQLPQSMGEGLAAVQALALLFGDRPPQAVDDLRGLARDVID